MPSPPDEFLCPITLTLMRDPVIGPDGHSYERTAITQWLQTNPHSPLTRQLMTAQMLQPNYSLKSAIERYTRGEAKAHSTPRPKLAPRPQLLPALPSAPRASPPLGPAQAYPQNSYVVQAFVPELQQPLIPVAVPVSPPPLMEAQRRQKILGACVCFTFTVILVIIIIRFYEGLSD